MYYTGLTHLRHWHPHVVTRLTPKKAYIGNSWVDNEPIKSELQYGEKVESVQIFRGKNEQIWVDSPELKIVRDYDDKLLKIAEVFRELRDIKNPHLLLTVDEVNKFYEHLNLMTIIIKERIKRGK
jgi:hypothetical protein